MLLNPTGGLVGGDVLETSVVLGRGSRVCLTTPAATRVYRSAGPPAVQRFRAAIGQGALLEYLPGHLIPSPGARLRQSVEVTLAADASLLLVDSWAVGRPARGERWCFDAFDASLVVTDGRRLLLKERCTLERVRRDGLGWTEGFPYIATFVALAGSVQDWDQVAQQLLRLLDAMGTSARAGVSTLARGGVLGRLLCPSAPVLEACVRVLWEGCRRNLFGLGPLALRKF
jgi:urease accessory protein